MEIINNYITEIKNVRKYSDNTIEAYYMDILEFFSFLKDKNITYNQVDYDLIRKYLSDLFNKADKNTTISRKISALRGFYGYLTVNDKIKSNPFRLVKLPKKNKKLPRFFYYNEIEELFNSVNNNDLLGRRDLLILEMLYATGLRVSELINIKTNDIDFNKREIKVMGKGSKERIVYFGEYALDALNNYLKYSYPYININNSESIFLNARGEKLTRRGIAYILDKIIKDTSIDKRISPHMLRHTFATHLLNEGCDILAVQELLGHESISATSIYTHITDDQIKEIYYKSHPRAKD